MTTRKSNIDDMKGPPTKKQALCLDKQAFIAQTNNTNLNANNTNLPLLPRELQLRILKECNDFAVKEKQKACQKYNRREKDNQGQYRGLYVKEFRYVKYTLKGGRVCKRLAVFGNCIHLVGNLKREI